MDRELVLPLREYQQAGIDKFFARPDRRLILAHSTSAGKTRTTVEIAKRLQATSMLVIGSAQSRATWPREFERWWPEQPIHSVRFGAKNKSLTKAQAAERELAYASPFQVVSYSLLKHIDARPRQLVVFDEAHALRSPTSQQSRIARSYLRACPDVSALLLTATPIPTEVQNIWNLVDTLFPGYLGEETDTGDIAWGFKRAYCEKELQEWAGGKAWKYFGANKAALPRLANKLEPIMHRVSSAEVAAFTPKLNASILWVDEPKQKDAAIATEWLDARDGDESTHIGLFAWTHATAGVLADAAREAGWPVVVITGLMHPEARQNALDHAEGLPRACVIGTAGSLAESISLSFIKQALVFEWRATPGQALQFSGRFARQDSKSQAPTYLLYVARDSDEQAARVLRTRLDAAAALYEADSRAEEIREIMAPRALTEERLQVLSASAFSETRVSLGGFIDEDEDDT